jgi:hypothetical protein
MSFKALKPGQVYKVGEDGELVEANVSAAALKPVDEEELPPDLRSNNKQAEAERKIQDLTDSVKKLSDSLDNSLSSTPTVKQDLTISEEERMAFLKAIIGNKPYKKEFKIFNDSIKFTLRTLTTAELDAVSEAIVIQSGRIPYSTMLAMAGAHMRFCMTCSLCEIEFTDEETGIIKKAYKTVADMYPDKAKKDSFYVRDSSGNMSKKEVTVPATPGQKVMWAAQDKFADISVPLYNIIFEKYQKFDAEVLQMTKESGNADFFLAGGAGPSS